MPYETFMNSTYRYSKVQIAFTNISSNQSLKKSFEVISSIIVNLEMAKKCNFLTIMLISMLAEGKWQIVFTFPSGNVLTSQVLPK